VAPARPPTPIPPRRPFDEAAGPTSPCIRQCCLDDADECIGCGRTLEEIKAWHGADEGERRAILDAAAQRRQARATGRRNG
jgi:predicted Fe-S protein YdhL (DUF1289 family)